ncbi:MAG: ribonuclease R [Alistipes sp.]|nr:ribonuclease R [Alistipes sp.]
MDKDLLEERKKMICGLVNDELYVPMKIKELAVFLQVAKEERGELAEVLEALVNEGKLTVTKKGKYCKADEAFKTGTFISNQKGFGFVEIEGEEEDIFIPESEVNGAFHLDKVQVKVERVSREGKRREGTVVKVIEHGITDVVGTFESGKSFGFVLPDNGKIAEDIFIPKDKCKGAMTGHKVVVHINRYPAKGKNPEGEITEIIGHINDPGTDILSVVKSYDIPMEFPKEVMDSLDKVPERVSEEDKTGRMDIRNWQTVTIDGEDAKDLDDAITISREGKGYRLGVHIADVSHYVKENSPLDREAVKRGTSVYLVDRVIPMLPHKLSNGICSLNQGEDRLALSCIMEIDEKGNVTGHKIAETLINVDRRMSYTNVKKILVDKDEAATEEYRDFVPMFELMEELALLLRAKRRKRGSIDFDFPESKITLDKNGKVLDVKPYERNTATRIIEDFMLIANETVAEDYFWQELPFVYRTHDNPDSERVMKLSMLVNNFGYSIRIGNDDIHPKELQKLLDKIADTPEEAMISRLTLRFMKRAQYSTQCTGHFGLAAKYYCHFTSPIRRYPDLQIHRIIKENLHGGIKEKRLRHYDDILPEVAKHASTTERRADEAERDTEKLKKVEYMSERIGCEYEGVISGMTSFGIYVELMNTVEGMVKAAEIPHDYFIYDEEHFEMRGERTKTVYKLGQKVKIRVVDTDKLMRTIDFVFVEDEENE